MTTLYTNWSLYIQSVVQAITGGCAYHYRNPKCMFNKGILCGGEDNVKHFLEFCMRINDQRVALMTSVNILKFK